jgi:hypothetical protein
MPAVGNLAWVDMISSAHRKHHERVADETKFMFSRVVVRQLRLKI